MNTPTLALLTAALFTLTGCAQIGETSVSRGTSAYKVTRTADSCTVTVASGREVSGAIRLVVTPECGVVAETGAISVPESVIPQIAPAIMKAAGP